MPQRSGEPELLVLCALRNAFIIDLTGHLPAVREAVAQFGEEASHHIVADLPTLVCACLHDEVLPDRPDPFGQPADVRPTRLRTALPALQEIDPNQLSLVTAILFVLACGTGEAEGEVRVVRQIEERFHPREDHEFVAALDRVGWGGPSRSCRIPLHASWGLRREGKLHEVGEGGW
jgi:hypothetical protein